MAALTIQELGANGALGSIILTAGDVAGDTFLNDGQTMLICDNTDAGPQNITINGIPAQDSGRDEAQTVAIAAGAKCLVGPFKPRNWNNGLGQIDVTVGNVAVLLAAVRYSLA